MAHSLAAIGPQVEGAFDHAFSHTRFAIRNVDGGLLQSWQRDGESESLTFQYVVGSGTHAFGYLTDIGDHLFQSPLSYYSLRREWDVAPGYEKDPAPDFTRPVTAECVNCHSGAARPVSETLNTYMTPPFAAMGITCERCHGNAEAHLKKPVPGSILNPAKLPEAARDSICEQCHLSGAVRIPNPGKTTVAFRPGETLEQNYTVYVVPHGPEETVKVISQAEQLALSTCKRSSGGRLWCGTCHDPHDQPTNPIAYFRERCLSCHRQSLNATHSALTNCIGCHMPRRPAKDGGHTAFTDHRISRRPEAAQATANNADLVAWREPAIELRDRNMALALVTAGLENHDSTEVIRGYRMLNRLPEQTQKDPAVLTALGSILLTAKESAEASQRFQKALSLRPGYAPYEVNLAMALLDEHRLPEAIAHLEHALELDPLLQNAVSLLARAYADEGERVKAAQVVAHYDAAMGIKRNASKSETP